MEGKTSTLAAPLTVHLDPTNLCNVNCFWCRFRDYRSLRATSIDDRTLLEIPKFLAEWGVKAVVLSGGEPLLHPKAAELIVALREAGLQIGLETNGLALDRPEVREAVKTSVAWVLVSVDAATAETYLSIKKAPLRSYEKVLGNIKWLSQNKRNGEPKISLKFLIHHTNYSEQFSFCDLAKTAGADSVIIHPLYSPKYRFTKGVRKTAEFYLREARKQFETDTFKIYGIVHKVEREWDRAIRFSKCQILPLTGVFGADTHFYLCPDRRGDATLSLGSWYPFDAFQKKWGSDEHRDALKSISPNACPLCNLSIANEIIERCIQTDGMELDFLT